MPHLSHAGDHGRTPGRSFRIQLSKSGEFTISADADDVLRNVPLAPSQIGATSGYIRSNQGLILRERDLATLRDVRMPAVQAKASKLLLSFATEYPRPGMLISNPYPRIVLTLDELSRYDSETTFPDDVASDDAAFLKWLAISYAGDAEELEWLIFDVLVKRGFLDVSDSRKHAETVGRALVWPLVVTASGWTEIERIRNTNSESALAFVAMSFHRDLTDLYSQGIAPGIKAAGYEPLRVDQKEHNNRIDDEIIASIRTSRFLVADFSIDRGGIYFEAGYALGLDLPVIWLVRESAKDTIHFDNRQYNFIRWNADDYRALAAALKNRIEATIGRGPAKSDQRPVVL